MHRNFHLSDSFVQNKVWWEVLGLADTSDLAVSLILTNNPQARGAHRDEDHERSKPRMFIFSDLPFKILVPTKKECMHHVVIIMMPCFSHDNAFSMNSAPMQKKLLTLVGVDQKKLYICLNQLCIYSFYK